MTLDRMPPRQARPNCVPLRPSLDLFDRLEGLRLLVRAGNALHLCADVDERSGRRALGIFECKGQIRAGGHARD